MKKSPAFSFYAKDFLTGTATMTLAERGAYVTLLSHQWDSGTVPSGDAPRSRLLGTTVAQARTLWAAVSVKFERQTDGTWLNLRLEEERQKQSERRQKLAQNGSKGGAKTQAAKQQLLQQMDQQKSSLAFSSSSAGTANTPPTPADAGAVRVLRQDRAEARRRRTIVGGRCEHSPECQSFNFCVERIATELARERQDARLAS